MAHQSLTDREACIVLNLISGIGAVRMATLSEQIGSVSAILSVSEPQLAKVSGIGHALAERIANWQRHVDIERELGLAERAGVKIITKLDESYPRPLLEIRDHPLCLYVRGTLPDFLEPAIAIVGSRRISNYGRNMAEHLAEAAAYAGWTVVSGLAYGIDAIAHRACLDAGGITVAVLGGGLTRIHPQDHVPLARDIVEKNGAVITEFPMEFAPTKRSFPMRNRIVSGLSRATLVVEAGLGSGSLITANFALEQGRSVFAVPGQADNPQARGCNSLIRQGAKLTENFDDILEEFEFLPGFRNPTLAPVVQDSSESTVEKPLLLPEEEKILEFLGREEMGIDRIVAGTEMESGRILSILMKMELKGRIRSLPGKRYAARRQ